MAGRLFIVATPIGNIQDITLRAIETLKRADLIACEDTRHTGFLLEKYSIATPTTSYHKFNIKAKTGYIISQILSGKSVALVSDAGMPGISDPGHELVNAAAQAKIKVEVVPGANAAISALSVSGIRTDRFAFEGFLPPKSKIRKQRLEALAAEERTIIIYEAPHRIVDTLKELRSSLGDRQISVARELTKKFEEVSRGRISEIIESYAKNKPKGEFVLIIEGSQKKAEYGEIPKLLVKDMAKLGIPKSKAVRMVAERLGTPKNELYREALDI